MRDTHFYEPNEGHQLPHDPFKAMVAPRPIGWISTVDAEGRPNLGGYRGDYAEVTRVFEMLRSSS
jgi:predicted pyridoxine 5'-phosphate oxidase superfamily flavin-nucleotide-binding protein